MAMIVEGTPPKPEPKEKEKTEPSDWAIPMVFPDYLLSDAIPYFGHAAIIIYEGKLGKTKYLEYGSYEKFNVRGLLNGAVINLKTLYGAITWLSLSQTMKIICQNNAKGSRIDAAIIKLPTGAFSAMEAEAFAWRTKPYSLFKADQCAKFIQALLEAVGIKLGIMGYIPPENQAFLPDTFPGMLSSAAEIDGTRNPIPRWFMYALWERYEKYTYVPPDYTPPIQKKLEYMFRQIGRSFHPFPLTL